MTRRDKAMIEKSLDLAFEFERYVSGRPELATKIPDKALIMFQVKDDEAFNRWSRRVVRRQAKAEQPVVQITITKMGPIRSRIEALKVERAA